MPAHPLEWTVSRICYPSITNHHRHMPYLLFPRHRQPVHAIAMVPFRPRPTLTDEEISNGLRWLTFEGIASMGFGSIAGSGFLAAYALILGANNLQIGILAALPFITQPLQIPMIIVIERLRRRKLLVVPSWFAAQLLWIPIALIPVFIGVPGAASVSALLAIMAVRSLVGTVTTSGWDGWIRDLIPPDIRGSFISRRLGYATLAAIVFGLGASGFVEFWKTTSPGERMPCTATRSPCCSEPYFSDSQAPSSCRSSPSR